MFRAIAVLGVVVLGACASVLPQPLPDVLILGEQHDAPLHQRLHAQAVQALARRGELAGVAIEMATVGRSTAGLARDASEAQVRMSLNWTERGWPWEHYAPAVMAAVRHGVPVVGADPTREQLKQAATDPGLEALVSPQALQTHVEQVREGHCGLMPAAQLLPLARAQIARDRMLAQTVAELATPQKTAVLITGLRHADPQLGVPLHLPPTLRSISRNWPLQPAVADYCEQLRKRMRP